MGFKNKLWVFIETSVAITLTVIITIFAVILFPTEEEIVVNDQRVIITGSSSGIGEGLAYAYASRGSNILITARREDLLNEVRKRCLILGAKTVIVVRADLALAADRARVVREAKVGFEGKLDVLLLSHAFIQQFPWNFTEENLVSLRQTLEINFLACAELASATMDMLKKANGKIGFMSSTAGKIPQAALASYSAAKFALDGFFSVLRAELRLSMTNVSVTNCLLGWIATESVLDNIRSGKLPIDKADAISVNETAVAIINSVHRRERELFYPKFALLQYWVYRLFPDFTENFCAKYTCTFNSAQQVIL